jgi:redox-sensing transcriptional repressor
LGYHGLREHRFNIVGVFDSNAGKVGTEISGMTIHHIDDLSDHNRILRARIAIVAVPSQAAQSVSDVAIHSGVRALLNFAPIILQVPEHVVVRNVSFMQELAVLSHNLSVDTLK